MRGKILIKNWESAVVISGKRLPSPHCLFFIGGVFGSRFGESRMSEPTKTRVRFPPPPFWKKLIKRVDKPNRSSIILVWQLNKRMKRDWSSLFGTRIIILWLGIVQILKGLATCSLSDAEMLAGMTLSGVCRMVLVGYTQSYSHPKSSGNYDSPESHEQRERLVA